MGEDAAGGDQGTGRRRKTGGVIVPREDVSLKSNERSGIVDHRDSVPYGLRSAPCGASLGYRAGTARLGFAGRRRDVAHPSIVSRGTGERAAERQLPGDAYALGFLRSYATSWAWTPKTWRAAFAPRPARSTALRTRVSRPVPGTRPSRRRSDPAGSDPGRHRVCRLVPAIRRRKCPPKRSPRCPRASPRSPIRRCPVPDGRVPVPAPPPPAPVHAADDAVRASGGRGGKSAAGAPTASASAADRGDACLIPGATATTAIAMPVTPPMRRPDAASEPTTPDTADGAGRTAPMCCCVSPAIPGCRSRNAAGALVTKVMKAGDTYPVPTAPTWS